VADLARLFATYPGDSPVVLELLRPGDFVVRLQPRAPRGVKPDDELLARLRGLCGADAIHLEKPTPGV
jgi:hypothetical protein